MSSLLMSLSLKPAPQARWVRGAVSVAAVGAAFVALSPGARAQVTIRSENFDASGNPYTPSATATGAGTDYINVGAGAATGPNNYRVVTNPANPNLGNGFTSYGDHTTGSGQMLFFDGASSTSTRIWFDALTLNAGVTYTFSFWGSAGDGTSVPVLRGLIDGGALGTGADLTTVNGQWSQYTGTFSVGTTGTHTISIIDVNTAGNGNDGAIDDVLLTAPAAAGPEPGALALLLTGTLPMAGMIALRRRRNAA